MANRYKCAIHLLFVIHFVSIHLLFVIIAVNANGGHYAGSRTVFPANPFEVDDDAATLNKALEGPIANKKAIIDVLTKCDVGQRLQMAQSYKSNYGRDLVEELGVKLNGELRDVILAVMTPRFELYAQKLHEAVLGIGTDEETIIEILCSLSTLEIHSVAEVYEKKYNETLEEALIGDTSGPFRKMLVSLVQGSRELGAGVDEQMAKNDAQALMAEGVAQWYNDESVFQTIVVTRSYPQLQQTFYEYETLTGHTIVKAIESEFFDESKDLLLAIVKCTVSRNEFLAEKLHASIDGLGTTDSTLIRIIVTRSETDLGDIKEAYLQLYGTPLEDAIEGDTSGDYLYALHSLVY